MRRTSRPAHPRQTVEPLRAVIPPPDPLGPAIGNLASAPRLNQGFIEPKKELIFARNLLALSMVITPTVLQKRSGFEKNYNHL